MKKLLKNILPVVLVIILTHFGSAQNLYTLPSLHDSLRQMLTHIEKKTKNDVLQNVVREAKTLYTSNVINDSLSKKLLIIDSLLVNAIPLNQPMALSYTTTLVELFRHLPGSKEQLNYAGSLRNLARLCLVMGQYDKALPLHEQALAIRKKTLGAEHPLCATSLHDIANLYLHMGQHDKALPLFEQALAIRRNVFGEEDPEYATILNRMAFLNFGKGNHNKALHLYEQALAIRKKTSGEKHPDYANSLNNRGFLYFVMGQYDKAMPLYEQAIVVAKKTSEEHPEHAISLNRLGLLYFTLGQYDKALPLYEQALAIRKKISGEEHADYATVLNNLTHLYFWMGQYDKALPLYEKVSAIRKKTMGEMHPLYANNLNNLANLYYTIGDYEKALPLFRRSLAIRKKVYGEEHADYATSLNDLALLYFAIGQYHKAMPLFRQSLALRKKVLGEEHPDYATSLNNLADLYYTTGQYVKAMTLFQQSISIRKKILGQEHPDYVTSLNNLANLYSETGNFTNASALFIAASNSTLRHLNQTYATLSEHEKMKLFKIRASQFDYLSSLLFIGRVEQTSLVNQVYTNELALKGMVLEDQLSILNSIRKSGDSAGLQLYEQWRSNKNFFGKQLLLPIAKRTFNLDSLHEVTNQLEQQLSRRTVSFRNLKRNQAITVKDIVQKLQKGEAAVEFVCFRLYNKKWRDSTMYAAMILLSGDSTPHFIPLFEEMQLRSLLKSSFKKVNAVAAIQKLYCEDSLYQLIWKPLEKYLTGVHTVFYTPAGLLHRIAFQALRIDSGRLLINNYQLNQVLSTRSVALPPQVNKKPDSAAIWANIQYALQTETIASRGSEASPSGMDSTLSSFNFYTWDTRESRGKEWRPLISTKQEMESIAKELIQAGTNTAIVSETVATEEAFKALDGRSPEVLHLATHGFFLPVADTKPNDNSTENNVFIVQQNPTFRSGLVLAGANYAWKGGAAIPGKEDGVLTAYEIAQIDLSNTDLVVLSACETGLGDLQGNEGVIGLQRAFKMAGVKQLIVSLWRVPDKETAELMKLFYRNWLSGQTTREALRSAQLKIKEKYPSPYYWAAFVLIE